MQDQVADLAVENKHQNIILILLTNIIMSSSTSNVTAYPQGLLNRSSYFKTMFDTTLLPYNKMYDGRKLCYNVSKGTFIYKPHTDVGMIGRSSAGYLAQRKRM
jgi:hypothetical protein